MALCGATSPGLRKFFAMLDADGDNQIDFKELKDGLKMFGFNDEHLKEFMEHLDLNKDGSISYEEYKKVFKVEEDPAQITEQQTRAQVLLKLFSDLDTNNDGKISKDEWEAGMKKVQLSEDYSSQLRNYLDVNDDGWITKKEFMVGLGLVDDPIDWKIVFEALDKDKSGDLTVEELKVVFDERNIPILSSGIVEWISQYDKNKDGKLDYKEFLEFAKAEAARSQ